VINISIKLRLLRTQLAVALRVYRSYRIAAEIVSGMLLKVIHDKLEGRRAKGELRIIDDFKTNTGAIQKIDKEIDFASNDYLSFATDKKNGEEYIKRLQALGRPALGSTGSRTASGNSIQHVGLENRLAKFHNAEAALLFNSGYDANSSVWTYIPQPGDVVLFDQLIHASIHEGLKLSRASVKLPFDHNSEPELRRHLLELAKNDRIRKGEVNVFIAVESLYSMDGDICPLNDILETMHEILGAGNGYLIIDEVFDASQSYQLQHSTKANAYYLGTFDRHLWITRTRSCL
jgi:7-keto-8-aminopelargonate synthetase-like enzyme